MAHYRLKSCLTYLLLLTIVLLVWQLLFVVPDLSYSQTKNSSPVHARLAQELSHSLDLVAEFKGRVVRQRLKSQRANATFVALVRNSELKDMLHSLALLESTFNAEYQYPYVFLNDVEFTQEFKQAIQSATSARVLFGTIPKEHWSLPDWIDPEHFRKRLEEMKRQGISYGGLESYRHMCRFYSGFFYRHPILEQFDYYWRVIV